MGSHRHHLTALTRGVLATLIAAGATAVAAPSGAVPSGAVAAAPRPCGATFDDFAYGSVRDSAFTDRGWDTGIDGSTRGGVSFATVGGQRVAQLTARTDGTATGTRGAELVSRRSFPTFSKGTYAARIRFTDLSSTSPAGDEVSTGFRAYADTSSGPWYDRNDVATYRTSAGARSTTVGAWDHAVGAPRTVTRRGSLAGWHTVVAVATDDRVTYYVDGRQVADLQGGQFAPYFGTSIRFTHGFTKVGAARGVRSTVSQVDYVLYLENKPVTPSQVTSVVADYRARGVTYDSRFGGTGCQP